MKLHQLRAMGWLRMFACAFVVGSMTIAPSASASTLTDGADERLVVVVQVRQITLIPETEVARRRRSDAAAAQGVILVENGCGLEHATLAVDSVLSGGYVLPTLDIEMPLGETCDPEFPVDADLFLLVVLDARDERLGLVDWTPLFTDGEGGKYILPDDDGTFLGVDLISLVVPVKPEPEFGFGRTSDYSDAELAEFLEAHRNIACISRDRVDVCGGVRVQDWLQASR